MKSYIIPLTEIDDVSDQIYRKMLKQEWRDISEKEFKRLVISAGHHYKNSSVNYINIFRFMVFGMKEQKRLDMDIINI